MIYSLNIGDHVFVNKFVYGPELLPGILQLTSTIKPKRNDIIIFENPTYISRGPVFDIAQRVIYMLTLSLVDIDKDETGSPRVHFLIKRAVGMPGDHFIIEDGEMIICFAGENRWIDERDYFKQRGWNHNINRLIRQDQYTAIKAAGHAMAWADMQLPVPEELIEASASAGPLRNLDLFSYEQARLEMLRMLSPHDRRYTLLYTQNRLGRYVPEGRIYPLGDNRDNSRDGRHFGPVRVSKVLGKGLVIYWPLSRINKIK
jgi:signal peptidase I